MSLSKSSKEEIREVVKYKYLKNNKGKIRRRIKELQSKLSYYDCLIGDLTHDIEFENIRVVGTDEKQRYFNLLNDTLNKRRKMKDLLSFYAIIKNFYKKGGTRKDHNYLIKLVNRFETNTENRKYRKRAINKRDV